MALDEEDDSDEPQVMQMETYWGLRDEVVFHEQIVLRAMAFDTEPTPAYTFLTEFAWLFGCDTGDGGLLCTAWSLLNDAFCSEICALWQPPRLALACMLLAIEICRKVPELQAESAKVAK